MNTMSALDLQQVPDFVRQAYAGNIQEAIERNEINLNQSTYWMGKGNPTPQNGEQNNRPVDSYQPLSNEIPAQTRFQPFYYSGIEIRDTMSETNFNSTMSVAADLATKTGDDRNKQVFNMLMQEYPDHFEKWKKTGVAQQIKERQRIAEWAPFKLSFERDI